MELSDGSRICVDCEQLFVMAGGERKFFAALGLAPPNRCPACRRLRKEAEQLQRTETRGDDSED
jgi:hypothetical protein